MTNAIGRHSLHNMPMSPALYIVLRAQLRRGATDLPFNDAQLMAAFRRFVGKKSDKRPPSDERELNALAHKLALRDAAAKTGGAKPISPLQRQAMTLMGIAVPAGKKKTEKASAHDDNEPDADLDEKPAADMAEKLLDYARTAEPSDAVAAVMLAREFSDAPSMGVTSCDILLDKYGTRATNANEKHLILDGVAHVTDDHDRHKLAERFDTLAAHETDPELNTKILALKQDARDILKTRFSENGIQIIGKGQTAQTLTPEQTPQFVPVTPRKKTPFDLPGMPTAPKPPTWPLGGGNGSDT